MRAMKVSAPKSGTKQRILEAATRLFAEHGLDAVPLRDIAVQAQVNGAAINYHFGTKELLIREVYRRLFGALNEQRLRALDDCEVAAKRRRLKPDAVVRALVAPLVRFSSSPENDGIYFVRLVFHAYAVRRHSVDESIAEQINHIALRFVDALEAAIPKVDRETLFWRFDFAIGACMHILIDPQRGHRLKNLSDGLCDTDDNERIIDQLTWSLTASFTAPASAKKAARERAPEADARPSRSRSKN